MHVAHIARYLSNYLSLALAQYIDEDAIKS